MTTSQELSGDQHVQRYIETDGEEGYDWRNGTKILVLFTKGRKSGEERANALIFEPDGDDYLIVASKGGAPRRPPGSSTSRPIPMRSKSRSKATASRLTPAPRRPRRSRGCGRR
jgi:hypothetical protein